MRSLLILFFVVTTLCGEGQNNLIHLNQNWTFKSSTTDQWLPANVPGCIHSDLLQNKIITDPFYETNESQLTWIDTTEWIYKVYFDIKPNILSRKNIDLNFDGLDTYADVFLNGENILQANNMFRQWVVPAKSFLKPGQNLLIIHFNPAKKIADSIAKSQLPIIRPDNNRVYVRKAQFQFGWDWGPTFLSAGIYKNIWVDAYNDLSTIQKFQMGRDELNKNRTNHIKLIQQSDSIGTSFYFEKNGMPLYMKGANWIPADIFLNNITKERTRQLLQNAKDANMNMLRVWGGGIYESDDFYDLCDSMGIYVWQDFMFAGGMYPADKYFLQNVKEEVKQQIKRLRHHPCIVLWCGNNEIDEAWHNWGWQTQFNLHNEDSLKIWNEYQKLFKDSLAAWVNEFDGTRPYVSTSPKNGWGHKESFTEGDSHYWGLWWGLEDWEVFKNKTGRFVSEYGMQSMPDYHSVLSYTDSSNRYLFSSAINSHQKAGDGFKKLNHYLIRYFIDSTTISKLSLKDYCYITQCMQAFILKNVIVTHMSQFPKNMGSLLWQLNDCWPVTSWSIIDYKGVKKAAWYAVKKVYSDHQELSIETINKKNLIKNQPKFTLKENGKNSISIQSNCDAQYVYLYTEKTAINASDNYFNIKKGEKKIITFENNAVTKELLKELKVYSLNEFYLNYR
ncbi:MAG: glycoside hydrolase family 2 protein [Bacteroidota bacterium]